jgi:hypothetical protein
MDPSNTCLPGTSGGARSPADAAPAYAADLDWPVLALWWAENGRCGCGKPECRKPGKHPIWHRELAPNGARSATTDPALIREIWRRWPRANVAAACTRFFVVDADGRTHEDAEKSQGLDALSELEDLQGWLPLSPMSLSGRRITDAERPGGGCHIYFAPDERARSTVSVLAPFVDTKGGAGSYAILPPSVHESGHAYSWLPGRSPWDLPLAPAPAWLLDLLPPPRPAAAAPARLGPAGVIANDDRRRRYVEAALAGELERVAMAGKGSRNASLFKAAASLGRFVTTGEIAKADVRSALIDAAAYAGLTHHEATRTTDSGLKAAGAP